MSACIIAATKHLEEAKIALNGIYTIQVHMAKQKAIKCGCMSLTHSLPLVQGHPLLSANNKNGRVHQFPHKHGGGSPEVMTPVYMLTSEYTGYKNDHGNEQVVKNPKKAQTKECGLFSTMMFV